MNRLRRIVEKDDTRAGRFFDLTIKALILFSLITFSVSTIPGLSEQTVRFLYFSKILTVGIFSLEYLLRIIVAEKKLNYIFSFYGIIDLLAIMPFFLASGTDLRALRILRFLRLFTLLKMGRYTRSVERFRKVYHLVKADIVVFLTATVMLMYLGAVGIYYFENPVQPETFKSVFHSMWWSVATVTTVGYGDIYPVTAGGRVFTFLILLLSICIVAIPAGLIASAFQRVNQDEN